MDRSNFSVPRPSSPVPSPGTRTGRRSTSNISSEYLYHYESNSFLYIDPLFCRIHDEYSNKYDFLESKTSLHLAVKLIRNLIKRHSGVNRDFTSSIPSCFRSIGSQWGYKLKRLEFGLANFSKLQDPLQIFLCLQKN